MDVTVETVNPELSYGWLTVPVGTPSRIRPQGPSGHAKGVVVYCPGSGDAPANTAPVYIGNENVTADRSDSGGIPIAPGRSFTVPVNDGSELFVVANVEGQVLHWVCL